MVVRTLLESAMKKIALIAPREVANIDDLTDCLGILQSMLRLWAARRLAIYASANDTLTPTVGVGSYTWGTGGVITTPRPIKLLGGFVRDSGSSDYPVRIILERDFQNIRNKSTPGRPDRLFLYPSSPLAVLHLYPVPAIVESIYIDSMRPFTETSSFSAITDTISFPASYEEPIIYGLALRIAPEFGKTAPEEVKEIAQSSYETIMNVNAASQITGVDLGLPVGRSGSGYNINEG